MALFLIMVTLSLSSYVRAAIGSSSTFGFYFGSPTTNKTALPSTNITGTPTTNASSTFGLYFMPANLRNCSSGWNITGYFTPVEGDYLSPQKKIINVQGVGNMSYNAKFLNDVLSEGWGKTKLGWYIGYWDNTWHKSSSPLTSSGQPLTIGMVGTDPGVIHPNALISISSIPSPWNHTTYLAADSGGGLTGKHIDLYTGEGKLAQAKTTDVTANGKILCVLPKA